MPEFNPDNIPVLEDIIEQPLSPEQAAEKNNTDITDESPVAELNDDKDENLNSFSAEAVVETEIATEITYEESIPGNPLPEQHDDADDIDELTDLPIAADHDPDEVETDDSLSPFSAIADDDVGKEPVIIDTNDDVVFDTGINDIQPAGDHNEPDRCNPDSGNSPSANQAIFSEPPEPVESALIDYQQADTITSHKNPENEIISTAATTSESRGEHTTQTIALQPLVDDIIEQLMPGLEQQLRFLIQQALQDKLPEKIIKKEDPETDTLLP